MEFEKVLQELEEIAKKMEDKQTTLDESLALFDKGVKKSSECLKVLNETKGKAEQATPTGKYASHLILK